MPDRSYTMDVKLKADTTELEKKIKKTKEILEKPAKIQSGPPIALTETMDSVRQNQEEIQALSDETIERFTNPWIGTVMRVSDVFRNSLGSAVREVGSGIANELVDGTNDWQQAGKNMLKTLISMTVQMLIMLAIAKAIKAALGTAIGGPFGALIGTFLFRSLAV